MDWPALIVGLVALERLAELIYANRNTNALLRAGAHEIGRSHYPLIVLLHLSWLIAVYAFADKGAPPVWFWIAMFVLLQAARYWILVTLGRYWTTRIIAVPNAPLVAHGPYRFLRHPNYAVVIAEIAVLPLTLGEYAVAIVFSLLNAALLWWRIRVENAALNARR
ncbi:MAG TPA: isoprenylcysteine carboxylmethyltransferase family protein [Stellaceae bacterium]|jgi:methyltransferase